MEARIALTLGKPLVLVHEADVKHGGAELGHIKSECPEALRQGIFDRESDVICWRRTREMQLCALLQMAEAMLNSLPSPGALSSATITLP